MADGGDYVSVVTSRGAHAHALRVGTLVRAPSRLSNEIVYPPQLMDDRSTRACAIWMGCDPSDAEGFVSESRALSSRKAFTGGICKQVMT
jgi:hypothetical protein